MEILENIIAQLKEYEAPSVTTYETKVVEKETAGSPRSLIVSILLDPEDMNKYYGKELAIWYPILENRSPELGWYHPGEHWQKGGGDYESYLRDIINRVWRSVGKEKLTNNTGLEPWGGPYKSLFRDERVTERGNWEDGFILKDVVLEDDVEKGEQLRSRIEEKFLSFPFIHEIATEWV